MGVRLTAQCAEKALHSTSAVYHVAKASALYGERAVVSTMAEAEQKKTGVSYCQAVTLAAARYQEIMSLSEKGEEYKAMSAKLEREAKGSALAQPLLA